MNRIVLKRFLCKFQLLSVFCVLASCVQLCLSAVTLIILLLITRAGKMYFISLPFHLNLLFFHPVEAVWAFSAPNNTNAALFTFLKDAEQRLRASIERDKPHQRRDGRQEIVRCLGTKEKNDT